MAAPAPVKVYGPPLSTAVARYMFSKGFSCFTVLVAILMDIIHCCFFFFLILVVICGQPFGQVPAFEDESINHFESRAISKYVCDKYANQGNKGLFATNPLEKASIDQWLEAEGQNFNPPSSVLVFQLAFAPRMKIKQDENLIKLNEAKLAKVLDVYERRLGESRYLAGDEFTLADLSHLPNSQYLVNGTTVAELFTSRKNVERWWDEISSRESWKEVVEMQRSPSPRNA
ncbi:hypothetical protein RD792_000896 [Penstemon davidsonii]|uniref:glutathione transferase n=1 Tax=Penstemon davidsonii TaxID=160366 RepID=A0ABR0DMP4_9LAMI|nr:hypothetical protein RD792_000896 [Penstemon davidsonii]